MPGPSTAGDASPEKPEAAASVDAASPRRRGRPRTHGAASLRKTLGSLTTKRLDGRSAIAVAVRVWKADVTKDLGGDLSRAQQTLLEQAAQAWVIVQSLDDYISRQPSLVTKKRQVIPVVLQRTQLAESLERTLVRLGLDRRAQPTESFHEYVARRDRELQAERQQGATEGATT